MATTLRIGVDTGGTFTDLILLDGEQMYTCKHLSTPHDPSEAVLAGIQILAERWLAARHDRREQGDGGRAGSREASGAWKEGLALDGVAWHVTHGSTVATNAVLEGKGAKAAFVTTAGFEDTLAIARQHRPELYALSVRRPAPPVPAERCFGLEGRVRFDGTVQHVLTSEQIEALVAALREADVEAVAVSLLHSYANPTHEQAVGAALSEALPGVHVTLSHTLLPEFREYERASTCVVNAIVAPPMNRYLRNLADELGEERLRIMASGGGSAPLEAVCERPVQTILSGPAGGVVGAFTLAKAAGFPQIITLDMGGTSTDVALCLGELGRTTESEINALPIRLPMLDIHTVGAGGGSIAWIDEGGVLRVGPQSAGADPGPACYGQQQDSQRWATVTDAHVVLGHLPVDNALGGSLVLRRDLAEAAIQPIADAIGAGLEDTARGIIRIAEATMARAVQRISLQRGHDPRDFVLLPFGGAGGLHACALAEELGMERILIPRCAGLLSALGMLYAPPLYQFSRSVLSRVAVRDDGTYPDPTPMPAVEEGFAVLRVQAHEALERDGVSPAEREIKLAFDLRYVGQSFEITVPMESPCGRSVVARFLERHLALYGYLAEGKDLEVVTLRAEAVGPAGNVVLPPIEDHDGACMPETQVIERATLAQGQVYVGPLILTEASTTTYLREGWHATIDAAGHLVLSRNKGEEGADV